MPRRHDRLLRVLLAEEGDVGPTMFSSFATTVATPRKCSRPRRCVPSEQLGQGPDADGCRIAVGVDLLDGRREQHVDAGPRATRASRASSRG